MALISSDGRQRATMKSQFEGVPREVGETCPGDGKQNDADMNEIVEKLKSFHITDPISNGKRNDDYNEIDELVKKFENLHMSDDKRVAKKSNVDIDEIVQKLQNFHISHEENDEGMKEIIAKLENFHIIDGMNDGKEDKEQITGESSAREGNSGRLPDEDRPVRPQPAARISQAVSPTITERCFSLWRDGSADLGASSSSGPQRQVAGGDATVDDREIKLRRDEETEKEDIVRPRSERLTRHHHDGNVFLAARTENKARDKISAAVHADYMEIVNMLENLHFVAESKEKQKLLTTGNDNKEERIQGKLDTGERLKKGHSQLTPGLYDHSVDTELNAVSEKLENFHLCCYKRRPGSNVLHCW